MTRALRDDEEDVPLLLDRCDDLFERGVVLRTVADQSFELCLRRAAVRHLVADEEEVAFLAALLERVALRAVREEVQYVLVALLVGAAALRFEVDVRDVVVHLDAGLELPDLERSCLAVVVVADGAEEHLRVLDVRLALEK